MIVLEDELRSTFTESVQRQPTVVDPAGKAIQRARAIRRRRSAVAGVAVMAAAVSLVGGLSYVQEWRSLTGRTGQAATPVIAPYDDTATIAAPQPNAPVAKRSMAQGLPPALDLEGTGLLMTSQGDKVTLKTEKAEATEVYRLPRGWLVDAEGTLSLVRVGAVEKKLADVESWTIDASGSRLAYVQGATLHLAELKDDGLHAVAETTVPSGTRPVTFAQGRIVLATMAGGQIVGYDYWNGVAPYAPLWTEDIQLVYGVRGETLVGLAVGPVPGSLCLATIHLAARGFQVGDEIECDLGLASHTAATSLSEDGRWLAVRGTASVLLYDLDQVFSTHASTAVCLVTPAADKRPTDTRPNWEGPDSVLVDDEVGVLRCRTDGTVERVPMPTDAPPGWDFVARTGLSATK